MCLLLAGCPLHEPPLLLRCMRSQAVRTPNLHVVVNPLSAKQVLTPNLPCPLDVSFSARSNRLCCFLT